MIKSEYLNSMYGIFLDKNVLTTKELLSIGFTNRDLTRLKEKGILSSSERGFYEINDSSVYLSYLKNLVADGKYDNVSNIINNNIDILDFSENDLLELFDISISVHNYDFASKCIFRMREFSYFDNKLLNSWAFLLSFLIKDSPFSEVKNTKIDNKLMKRLRTVQEERYGIQQMKEVSYSTTPGKAVLVVGSNIRELEDVLEALKEEDIDVYTHDEMMLAHTFPKFSEYTSLKGQYGQGMENCLLDFSTFPGPIILTRHSLYNVENLYRGRLYTTDFAYSKGVISIHNKDFSDVIKSANEAKGFKTGKQCETVHIGCNFEASVREIDEKIKSGKYSNVFIIGLNGYTIEQQAYFDKLLDKTPDNVLIISLSYSTRRENAVYINACFDTFAIVRFAEAVSEKLPIALFFPKCDRHTISQMIYMSTNPNMQIYVGKCTPIILNPNLIDTLHKVFGINGLTSVKKDLDDILNKK